VLDFLFMLGATFIVMFVPLVACYMMPKKERENEEG